MDVLMKKIILLTLFLTFQAFAGLPPTTSKGSSDSSDVTTFKFRFPNFAITHSGTIATLGVLNIAGGGTNNGSLAVTAGGVLYTDGSKLVNTGAGTSGQYLASSGSSAPAWTSFKAPTVQTLLSGSSATYTTPSSPTPLYLKVTVIGGGGGGGGLTVNGGAGSPSSFGPSITANGGGAGGANATGAAGAGGTCSITTSGTLLKVFALDGGGGQVAGQAAFGTGGSGGNGYFGGGGGGGGNNASTGAWAGRTNSSGGGGGSGGTNANGGGSGGGAGGSCQAIITSPSGTYTYTVGGGGTAGTTGGGAGGSGIIIVEEFYQ